MSTKQPKGTPFQSKIMETEMRHGEVLVNEEVGTALYTLRKLGKPDRLKYVRSLADYIEKEEPKNPVIKHVRMIGMIAEEVYKATEADADFIATMEETGRKAFLSQLMG
jgi:hypothetical protein